MRTSAIPVAGRKLGALQLGSIAIIAIAAVVYVLGPILDSRIPEVFRHIDWVSYSRAAARFLAGQPLYVPDQLSGPYEMAHLAGIGYVYPPPSILLFVPFLALGPTTWAIANAVLFASGLAAMARADFGRYAGLAFGVALLAVGLSAPYLDAMVMGNVNLGVAGLFALTWALGRGSRQIGWLAAAGGLVKIHPFALAGFTRPAEARRTVGTAIVVAIVVTLITLPLVGVGSWIDFERAATNARPLCGYGVDAVACGLIPVVGGLAMPALLVVAGLLVIAAIWVQIDLLSFALITIAVLVAAPEVFGHTFLLGEVLVFAVAGALARRRLGSVGR
jgi:Glycosyltransferase family 87